MDVEPKLPMTDTDPPASFHKTLVAGVLAVKRSEEGGGDADRRRQSPTGDMDFSALNEALASNSYDKVADVCDDLMLRVAAEGASFQDEWPYAFHLLGYLFVNDINSARFLWKSIPPAAKEARPEIVAVWRIGQRLWTRDYAGVHEAVRGFDWGAEIVGFVNAFSDKYKKTIFELLLSAYSTISVDDTAQFLGMTASDATNYVLQHGWTLDSSSGMLTVTKRPIVTEQKLDSDKLQRLTEYVFQLEH